MVATMLAVLGAGAGFVEVLKRTMPGSLHHISDDILALDALAYITTSLQQASYTQHRRDYSDRDLDRAWLQLTSVARTIKEFFLDKIDPALGLAFLDRWKEFRSIEVVHERFHMLGYVLFTSRGHHVHMHRYPDSPPVILDLELGIESGFAELPCAQYLIDAVNAFKGVVSAMPEDDDEFEDETEGDV